MFHAEGQSDQLGSPSTVSTWQRFAATWGISCLSGRRTARALASRGAAGGCLAPSWHGFLAGATQLPSSPLILHQRVGSSAQKPGPGGDLSDKKALHFFVTGMSCPSWQWHRTGSRWSPVRTLPVAPLWCDLGFVPNSRGIKAAANLRPTVQDNRFTNSSNLRRLQSGKRHILHLIKL